MQCGPRARNSCIEKVGFSSTLLPVFCLSLLPVYSCSKNICSRRFLALHLLSLAGSWPFRNFTFTCHLSFTYPDPCVLLLRMLMHSKKFEKALGTRLVGRYISHMRTFKVISSAISNCPCKLLAIQIAAESPVVYTGDLKSQQKSPV